MWGPLVQLILGVVPVVALAVPLEVALGVALVVTGEVGTELDTAGVYLMGDARSSGRGVWGEDPREPRTICWTRYWWRLLSRR